MSLLDDEEDLIENNIVMDYRILDCLKDFLKINSFTNEYLITLQKASKCGYFRDPNFKFSLDLSEYKESSYKYYIGIDYMNLPGMYCKFAVKLFDAQNITPNANIIRTYSKSLDLMFDDTSKRNFVGNYKILNTSFLLQYLYGYIGPTPTGNYEYDSREGWLMFDIRNFLNPNNSHFGVFEVIGYGHNC
jgi:hypothetical protein